VSTAKLRGFVLDATTKKQPVDADRFNNFAYLCSVLQSVKNMFSETVQAREYVTGEDSLTAFARAVVGDDQPRTD
jgi:hypothetical protein